jgi:hypothetical protein
MGHVAVAVVGRMHGAVEMRADMERRVDATIICVCRFWA